MLELESRSTIRWEGSVYSTIYTLISTVCCFHSQTLDFNGQTPRDVIPWTLGHMPEVGKGTDCICSWTPSVSGKSATSPIQTGYSALSTHAQIVYTAYTYTHLQARMYTNASMHARTHACTCATPTHTLSLHSSTSYSATLNISQEQCACDCRVGRCVLRKGTVFLQYLALGLCVSTVGSLGALCSVSVPWQFSKHWVWLRNVPSSVRERTTKDRRLHSCLFQSNSQIVLSNLVKWWDQIYCLTEQ